MKKLVDQLKSPVGSISRTGDFFIRQIKLYHSKKVFIHFSLAGGVLCTALIALRLLSAYFEYGTNTEQHIIFSVVGLMIVAGLSCFVIFFLIPKLPESRALIGMVLIFGFLFRLLFFWSTPIYEDDWHRYLWDGASVSNGVNPYLYPPATAAAKDSFGESIAFSQEDDLRRLQEMGREHSILLDRVNYPYVSTIYPPLAQLSFAVAYQIKPFSLNSWRAVLLLFDGVSLWLLLSLLQAQRRKRLWVLLYWWNPVLILTTYNAGHMDVLIGPFLLGALLLVQKEKPKWAALSLAAAASVKFWPLIAAPILFRAWRRNIGSLILIIMTISVATALLLAPMIMSLNPEHSGLTAYAQSWRNNAFIFPLLSSFAALIVDDGGFLARITVAMIIAGTSLFIGAYKSPDETRTPFYLLTVTLLLFVLSPTGYPWYFIWLLWFIPLAPSLGGMLLTVTLPLYYARYYLQENGIGWVFENILVPIEFLPPILLILFERVRKDA